ncbi:hypothetical protein PRIPAC_78493 [Pristionchus pacificus]|nr:hypothetical protein PRIPAC_78493 [Pristionchus pacificus]
MRWHSIILIAGVFLVVESAKYSHEKKSHFTSVEDEEERENEKTGENGHLFDVKKIVKGTIDAIGGKGTTPKPDGLYSLFQLPSEILTQIASDAGYIEPSTTIVPKRRKKRRNHKAKKYRKVSEDGSYEGTYVRVEDEEDEEDEDAYKPRKKSKRRHHQPIYLPPNYVPPPMVSSPPLQSSLHTQQLPSIGVPIQPIVRQQVPQMDPLTSIFAPLPSFTFAPLTTPTTTTTSAPPTMAPLSIQPLQSASPMGDSVGAQYAYQPVVQADGKTYYHRVLVLPPTHVGDPSPQIIMPTTQQMITTTTQTPTTTNSFVTEGPTTTTEEPSTTEGLKRKTKIRRRLIKNTKTQNPIPAEAIQQLPQSDSPVVSSTMRSVAITFSPNLELFKTTAPSVEISLQEQKEVKIKPRTHGTRTHSVGKAIESGTSNEGLTNQPSLRYVKDEETDDSEESTRSSLPTPPVPSFSPKLITTQLPSNEEQMKNNEVFSVSLETGKKGSGTLSVPQVTALHSIANRRLQVEEDYLPPIEEKKEKKKGMRGKKERKEERVKKVESTEIEDIKEAVEAVRREKKEKVQRFHQEEDKKEEEKKEVETEEEEEEAETTTQKPKRRHHKKKSQRTIEVDTPKKIALSPPEEDGEESVIPTASPSSSSFRRSLTPALIDVRELNTFTPYTNSPSIRHIHHAERLAILRKSLEARARGVKQLSTQDKEEDDEDKNEVEESKPSTPLYSDLFPSTTTEIARKKKTRRHRKRKTTVTPTTTTTTEVPTTTEEKEEESYELNDEDYEEEIKEEIKKADLSYEFDEDGDKVVKKKTKKTSTTTTTTETPSTTTVSSKKLKVLRPHCLNIRSFARQFGMVDVFDFVEEHCSFIENYYPSLTCERREEYLAYCAGMWDSTKL